MRVSLLSPWRLCSLPFTFLKRAPLESVPIGLRMTCPGR